MSIHKDLFTFSASAFFYKLASLTYWWNFQKYTAIVYQAISCSNRIIQIGSVHSIDQQRCMFSDDTVTTKSMYKSQAAPFIYFLCRLFRNEGHEIHHLFLLFSTTCLKVVYGHINWMTFSKASLHSRWEIESSILLVSTSLHTI